MWRLIHKRFPFTIGQNQRQSLDYLLRDPILAKRLKCLHAKRRLFRHVEQLAVCRMLEHNPRLPDFIRTIRPCADITPNNRHLS